MKKVLSSLIVITLAMCLYAEAKTDKVLKAQQKAQKQAQKEVIRLEIPMVGTLKLNAEDIEKLYGYIKNS